MVEEMLITAPIPSEGFILDVRDPLGNSVLIVPKEEYLLRSKMNSHPIYNVFCCIKDDMIVASADYPYESIHPVMGIDFTTPEKQCERSEEKWK